MTNDDGVRSDGDSRAGGCAAPARRRHRRRAADRGQRDRPRAHAAPAAAHGTCCATASTRWTARRPTASTSRISQIYSDGDAAGSDRVGHQQGLQPRRRRDLFGDRVGRARRARCSASRASPCRWRAAATAYDFAAAAAAGARRRRAVLREGLPPRDVSQHQRADRPPQGVPA